MSIPISNNNNRRNNYFEIAGLISFILVSAFVVLHFEYKSGNFLFKFFKSKVYYANFNKIIFPIYFWLLAFAFILFKRVLDNNFLSPKKIIQFFSWAFLYHLFLIVLTHSTELTPGFPLKPIHLPALPYSVFYAKGFVHAFFFGYYLYAIYIIKNKTFSYEWLIPLTILIPFLFGYSPWLHLTYAGIASVFLFISNKLKFITSPNKNYTFHVLIGLFLLSLGFRLWYASYLSSIDGVGLSADGPSYYQSAKKFAAGEFSKVDYLHAPFYSLYLSVFVKIFGNAASSIFFPQAVIGAFLPILVVRIVKKLGDENAAIIAGILVSVFPLCIHFSVVINRASLQIIILALLVNFCLFLKDKNEAKWCFVFGSLLGAEFYLAQETLPILIFLFFYGFWKISNQNKLFIELDKKIVWGTLGIITIWTPLNGIFYSHSQRLMLLGRDASLSKPHEVLYNSWIFGRSEYSMELNQMGFNPLQFPISSLQQLISDPLKIIPLYWGRILDELSSFLFAPGSIHIAPLNLEYDSFYGANLQFYLYFFIIIGLIQLIRTHEIGLQKKSLIIIPIFLQMLVVSSFLFGAFRYRAPFAPFYLIIASFGIRWVIDKNLTEFKTGKTFFNSSKLSVILGIYALGVFTLFLGSINFERNETKITKSQYKLGPWVNLIDNRLQAVHFATLNGTVFSFYDKNSNVESPNRELSFKICRFLMTGEKPYYLLLLDGEILGKPKKVSHGCSEIKETFNPRYDGGMLSLFVYFSPDGKILSLKDAQIFFKDKNKVVNVPLIEIPQSPITDRYKMEFNNFSLGYVKISRPIVR